MFFLYVDGSGNTQIKHKKENNGFYVHGGVIVHERDWKIIETRVTELKKEIFPDLEPNIWELHAHDIWNSRKFFANPDLKLNLERKNCIFSKLVELILKSPEITLINIIVLKDKLRDKYTTPKAKEYSWKMIAERFDHFLRHQNETTNNGLMFVDSDQKIPEEEIKAILWNAIRYGTNVQRIRHVIEDPIFTKSHLRNLIQLSDMTAYIVHRAYSEHNEFKEWLEKLKPSMYQPDGNLASFGLKEFP